MIQKQKLVMIIKSHGVKGQKVKAVEELSELQIAILNDVNKGLNCRNNIIEEIADVMVMIEQLKIIYEIPDPVIEFAMNEKVDREIRRIERQQWIDENLKG